MHWLETIGQSDMFPIALDLTRIPILLIGNGKLVERRLQHLKEAGATQVTLKDTPSESDIKNTTIVMVAGLPREQAEAIVKASRATGKLVNVEDINDLCDFYFTANIHRGDLVIAVSTSGASPTLARKIRDWLAIQFGQEWAAHVQELAALRKALKARGADMREITENTERHLVEKGWLLSSPPSLPLPHQGGENKKENASKEGVL